MATFIRNDPYCLCSTAVPPAPPLPSTRHNHFQTDILTTSIHRYFTPAAIRERPPLHINEIGGAISHNIT